MRTSRRGGPQLLPRRGVLLPCTRLQSLLPCAWLRQHRRECIGLLSHSFWGQRRRRGGARHYSTPIGNAPLPASAGPHEEPGVHGGPPRRARGTRSAGATRPGRRARGCAARLRSRTSIGAARTEEPRIAGNATRTEDVVALVRTTWARYCRNVVPAYRTWAALLPDSYAVAQEPNRSHAWINELPREMLDYRRDIRPGEQKRGPKGVRVPLYYDWKLMRYGRRGTLSRPVVVASQCRHVSHKNPCCAADAQLRFAHDLLSRGSKAKWFLLLDDDVFVHTYALARALATLDPTRRWPSSHRQRGPSGRLRRPAAARSRARPRPRWRRPAVGSARRAPRWARRRGRWPARRPAVCSAPGRLVVGAAPGDYGPLRDSGVSRRPRVRDRVPRAVRDGGGGSGPAAAARCPGAEAPPDRGAPQDRARGRPEEAARAVPRPAAPDLAPPRRVLRCRRRGGARRGDVPPLPGDRGVARDAARELAS